MHSFVNFRRTNLPWSQLRRPKSQAFFKDVVPGWDGQQWK